MANTASSSPRFISLLPHGPDGTLMSPREAACQDESINGHLSPLLQLKSRLPWKGDGSVSQPGVSGNVLLSGRRCQPLFLVTFLAFLPGSRARAGDKVFPLRPRGNQEDKSHTLAMAVQGARRGLGPRRHGRLSIRKEESKASPMARAAGSLGEAAEELRVCSAPVELSQRRTSQ